MPITDYRWHPAKLLLGFVTCGRNSFFVPKFEAFLIVLIS